jgi:hypothetical protein
MYSIRAWTPSRCGIDPQTVEEAIEAKELAIRLYSRLAEQGLPLFDDEPDSPADEALAKASPRRELVCV